MNRFPLLLLLVLWLPTGCTPSTEKPDVQEASPEPAANRYAIGGHDFLGIAPGASAADVIAAQGDLVDPRPRQTGEGLSAYLITADGKDLGFFLAPGPDAPIQAVVVLTPLARTEEGLGVGSTLDDIRALHPEVEVHGSEVESRVTALVPPHSFQLDVYIPRYELGPNEVAGDTRVIQVWITEPPPAQ